MTAIFSLLLSLTSLVTGTIPEGSVLRVRMNTPVGTWSSVVNDPINAVVIAPLIVNGQLLLPVGSSLAGRISSVTRVGFGIRHERASLGLEFLTVTLPDGVTKELNARVAGVDNARERVTAEGLIQRVRATSGLSYRASGYLKTMVLWHVHAELAEWAIKSLMVQLPESEIYYPAGTELTLSVTKQSTPIFTVPPARIAETPNSELTDLRELVASIPSRTLDPGSRRSSDLTNVLLVGSRSQIASAFRTAGWELARPLSVRARIGYIRAAADGHGYAAPMKPLLLNGVEPDMCFQKGLNDVAKRHHVRIWKLPLLWERRELWIAAATHDIDFAYLRPGRMLTHRIDENVDEEREKVANDLASMSCADPVWWVDRPQVPHVTQNGSGDSITTDTRVAVVRFADCSLTQPAVNAVHSVPLTTRGGRWQRLARRQILVTRNDLIRANPYWRMYEAARLGISYAGAHKGSAPAGEQTAGISSQRPSRVRQSLRLLSALH